MKKLLVVLSFIMLAAITVSAQTGISIKSPVANATFTQVYGTCWYPENPQILATIEYAPEYTDQIQSVKYTTVITTVHFGNGLVAPMAREYVSSSATTDFSCQIEPYSAGPISEVECEIQAEVLLSSGELISLAPVPYVCILSETTGWNIIQGDLNHDKRVDINDALLMARYSASIVLPYPYCLDKYADFNCDGKLDILDALDIARRTVGLFINRPCSVIPEPSVIPR